MTQSNGEQVLLKTVSLRKEFGPTIAVSGLDVEIRKGEVLGLVGANGAGKSTLIKMICGVIQPTSGEFWFDGGAVNPTQYSPAAANRLGIRVVHQELSLCKNLTVYENFYVEQSQRFKGFFGWRKKARKLTREALDAIFPDNGISENAILANLTIAQQQMVEIVRAASDLNLKLLILDEPTSSLPAKQTKQLQDFVKAKAAEGVSFIYISHRLKEITYLATRIFIMQNGLEVWQGGASATSEDHMISVMSNSVSGSKAEKETRSAYVPVISDAIAVRVGNLNRKILKDVNLNMYGGEIVGIAGLEGNGQLELLQEIFFARNKKVGAEKSGVAIKGRVAFVAGDRKKDGIFNLWSVADNILISKIASGSLFKKLSKGVIGEWVQRWIDELKIKTAGSDASITSLSGGNQQKALIARALLVDADIIILDDPTRGVDVATKNQLYEVFRAAAESGKLIIWRTTDDVEFEVCSRIVIMHEGRICGDYGINEIEVGGETYTGAMFGKKAGAEADKETKPVEPLTLGKRKRTVNSILLPVVVMAALYVLCGLKSKSCFSLFGFELIFEGCIPLIFVSIAQAFIIGLGHIDLGGAAFMGFINVVCCATMYENTALGLLVVALGLVAYMLMGVLIHKVNIPPIVVTMGTSFIWAGLSLTIMERPGGTIPEWVDKLIYFDAPLFSSTVWITVAFIVLATLIHRSRYGTVIRGFGNNDVAMSNSGWSRVKAYMFTYLMAAVYAAIGGLMFGAITKAADANASEGLSMLSIAAVVLGGGYLSGGVISHVGAALGAISMTLISIVLGQYGVANELTSLIQGTIILVILSLRKFRKEALQ